MINKIDLIKRIIENTTNITSKLKIYMVVNVKDTTTTTSDYYNYSVTTEFFSSSELNELVSAFRNCGIYTEVIFGEDEFINKILNTEIIADDNTLIYNASQNGTGPGRKSLIPAFCNLHRFRITGSNAYVVSLCRNKYHINKLLESHNIRVPQSWLFDKSQNGWLMNRCPPNALEVISKPIYESASIGIEETSKFPYSNNKIDFLKKLSYEMRQPIIVQEFIDGYESETPVIKYDNTYVSIIPIGISHEGNRILHDKFLTYKDIYYDDYSFYNFKNENNDIADLITRNSELVAGIVGMTGLGRVDYRIKNNGSFYVTDISTNPHLTQHSSYSYMFNTLGFLYHDIFKLLIGCAFYNY